MPGYDRTGPEGKGSKTGGQRGLCGQKNTNADKNLQDSEEISGALMDNNENMAPKDGAEKGQMPTPGFRRRCGQGAGRGRGMGQGTGRGRGQGLGQGMGRGNR